VPDIEQPIARTAKTWRDVEEAALFCPFLHAVVTVVAKGYTTREQALLEVALTLSAQNRRLIAELARDLSLRP
jgi:hypothetical protein